MEDLDGTTLILLLVVAVVILKPDLLGGLLGRPAGVGAGVALPPGYDPYAAPPPGIPATSANSIVGRKTLAACGEGIGPAAARAAGAICDWAAYAPTPGGIAYETKFEANAKAGLATEMAGWSPEQTACNTGGGAWSGKYHVCCPNGIDWGTGACRPGAKPTGTQRFSNITGAPGSAPGPSALSTGIGSVAAALGGGK